MTAADRKDFGGLIDRLYATWAKPAPQPRILSAAWDALEDFDLDTITAATKALIHAGGRFMPSTSDLRDACVVQRRTQQPAYAIPSAQDGVCATCEGVGQYQTRSEDYTHQTATGTPQTLTRSYSAPCPHCDRGRRIAARRAQGRTATSAQREVA